MNFRKQFFTLICILLSLTANSQNKEIPKNKVTMIGDTVYKNNIPQFNVKSKVMSNKLGAQMYAFYSFDKKTQAILTMTLVNDTIRFTGRFPSLSLIYDCLYPKIEFITLLESYINNKIIVDGKADQKGLEAYCKERNILLREIPIRKVARPGQDAKKDSIMTARALERQAKQFKFNMLNKGKKEVNVFLGDTSATNNRTNKPDAIPFRQGRYEMINAGETKELIGFEGEYVCITDSLHKIYDLRLLKKDLKTLTVKGNLKKFE